MPQKYFNVAGPCNSKEHYMLDPLRGLNDELMALIGRGHYFVIHAARQSGKTTLLKELARKINREGNYHALYCSLEGMQNRPDIENGIPAIIRTIKSSLEDYSLPSGFGKSADFKDYENVLRTELVAYCKTLGKPLVALFDETDCLSNGTLIAFLRQLRNGYINKIDVPFVHSLALVGMRNIRDYKAKIREDGETLGSSSPFNIVKESLNLGNFARENVIDLYSQHTKETGQVFEPQAVDYIFEQTQGQPWLVNAIACECVEKICKKDCSIPITQEMAKTAINALVLARGTHFDSLMERLKEERVRNVIEPLILGKDIDVTTDDYLYARDLGLIKESSKGVIPSNPIYSEVIVRSINHSVQEAIKNREPTYELPRYVANGKIDINRLLKEFQGFWRENSEIWVDIYKEGFYSYREAAPHLVLQAFLQRVLNGGGHISREMALGKMRSDICIEWEGQKYPIELKLYQGAKTLKDSTAQILKYMERMGSKEGWVVIFDRTPKKSWSKKLYAKDIRQAGKKITIFGC